ncbi:MAG TPA: ABC transporter, partial [Clostridiales bacterium]|nr:ABC transporter [Clostridiales bacterium]
DEPTGALDSETSTQVMALLREIAKDKLVIMVTHNAELAAEYSTRIIRLLDGAVTGDTDPYDAAAEETPRSPARSGSLSMSFATALSLSLNNLMTKKART